MMIIELEHDDGAWIGTLKQFENDNDGYLSKEETNGLRLLSVGETLTLPAYVGNAFTITRIE